MKPRYVNKGRARNIKYRFSWYLVLIFRGVLDRALFVKHIQANRKFILKLVTTGIYLTSSTKRLAFIMFPPKT